ncbi:hypothetical protein AB0D49_24630 [Streptomyces sp. NPDC048290]|uniref:hypothetical protein n=1 Tax=Streptomyces sp. NPDC048290 TaxID=3155811 RepID=UPI003421DD38
MSRVTTMDGIELMGGYAAYTTAHDAVRDLAAATPSAEASATLPLTFILTHITEILL